MTNLLWAIPLGFILGMLAYSCLKDRQSRQDFLRGYRGQ